MTCTEDTTVTESRVYHYGTDHIFTSRSNNGSITISSSGSEELIIDSNIMNADMPYVYSGTETVTYTPVYGRDYTLLQTIEQRIDMGSMNFSEDSVYLGFGGGLYGFNDIQIWKNESEVWSLKDTSFAVYIGEKCSLNEVIEHTLNFVVIGNDYQCIVTELRTSIGEGRHIFFKKSDETWTIGSTSTASVAQSYPLYNDNGSVSLLDQRYIFGQYQGGNDYWNLTNTIGGTSLVINTALNAKLYGTYEHTAAYNGYMYIESGGTWTLQGTNAGGTFGSIHADTVVTGNGSTFYWYSRSGSTWSLQGTLAAGYTISELKMIDSSNFCAINSTGIIYVYNVTVVSGIVLVSTIDSGITTVARYLAVGGPSRTDKSTYIAVATCPLGSYPGHAAETKITVDGFTTYGQFRAFIYKYTGLNTTEMNTPVTYNTRHYEHIQNISTTDQSLGSIVFSEDSNYFAIGDGYRDAAGTRSYNVVRVYKNINDLFDLSSTLSYRYSKTGPLFEDYVLNTDFGYAADNEYILVNGSWTLVNSDTLKSYLSNNDAWSISSVSSFSLYKPYLYTQTSGSLSMITSDTTDIYEYSVNTSTGAMSLVQHIGSFTGLLGFYADTIVLKTKIMVKSGGSWSNQYTGTGISYSRGDIIGNTVIYSSGSTITWLTRTGSTWSIQATKLNTESITDIKLMSETNCIALADSGIARIYSLGSGSILEAGFVESTSTSSNKYITVSGSSRALKDQYIAIGKSVTSEPNVSSVDIFKFTCTESSFSIPTYGSLNMSTNGSIVLAASTGISGTGYTGEGSVTVTGTHQSTSSTSGSLVVMGGLGVSRDMYVGSSSIASYTAGSVSGISYGSLATGSLGCGICTSGSLFVTGHSVIRDASILSTMTCSGLGLLQNMSAGSLLCSNVGSRTGYHEYTEYVVSLGSGSMSVPNTTDTKLTEALWTVTSVTSNRGPKHITSTSTGGLSFGRSGLYLCSVQLSVPYQSGGSGFVHVSMVLTDSSDLNPTVVCRKTEAMNSAVDPMIFSLFGSVSITSGQRLYVYVYQDSSGSLSLVSSANNRIAVYRGPSY